MAVQSSPPLPSSSATMRVSTVLLGVYDGYMTSRADARPCETKLGGGAVVTPTLSAAQRAHVQAMTRCGVCGRCMFLLVQAYCPLTSPSAHDTLPSSTATATTHTTRQHRMLYVYCCNSASCALQPSSSWVAFTVQYDAHTNSDDEVDPDTECDDEEDGDCVDEPLTRAQLPANCFAPCWVSVVDEPAADAHDDNDKDNEDEKRQLALMEEVNARARARCGIDVADLADLEAAVAACTAAAAHERQQQQQQAEDAEAGASASARHNNNNSNNNTDNDDDDTDEVAQRSFDKFCARVQRAPTQVMRYYARSAATPSSPATTCNDAVYDDAGDERDTTTTTTGEAKAAAAAAHDEHLQPLFMQPARVSRAPRATACTRCGAALLHEMQVMPAALYYLRVSAYTHKSNNNNNNGDDDDGVDFATVTVYTCARECTAVLRGVHVQREVLYVEAAPPLRLRATSSPS